MNTDHIRNLEAVRAALAAETDRDPTTNRVVAYCLYNLVKLEVIPSLEAELAAERQKPQPDEARIAAIIADVQSMHNGRVIPDHIRDALLQSVAPPAQEPNPEPEPAT
jgi:hypothetical protein